LDKSDADETDSIHFIIQFYGLLFVHF